MSDLRKISSLFLAFDQESRENPDVIPESKNVIPGLTRDPVKINGIPAQGRNDGIILTGFRLTPHHKGAGQGGRDD